MKNIQTHSVESIAALSDEALYHSYCQTKDKRFIGALYERYYHLLFGLCLKNLENKADSRDLVIQIFERIIIDPPNVEVEQINKWLYVMTKNKCRDFLRKKGTEKTRFKSFEADTKNSEDFFVENEGSIRLITEEDAVDHTEHLSQAMSKLKKEQQLCLKLFFMEEKSYKEIVAQTNYSLGEVKSYLQNGKRKLRVLLEASG